MNRPLGLGHFTFLHLSPAELVRLARGAGFDFVGMRFNPVSPGALNWLPDAAGLAELDRVMRGEGVGLYDVETVIIDATLDPAALVPMMEAAARLGGQRINTCADRFDGLVDRFAGICDLANGYGLGVDLECMAWRGLNTPADCLALLRDSGADNAGYLVDALHHTRCGGAPADLSAVPAHYLRSAQLCDAPKEAPADLDGLLAEARGGRLLPDEGGLPLAEILAVLPEDIVLSVELPSATDERPDLERARAIHAATVALMARARP